MEQLIREPPARRPYHTQEQDDNDSNTVSAWSLDKEKWMQWVQILIEIEVERVTISLKIQPKEYGLFVVLLRYDENTSYSRHHAKVQCNTQNQSSISHEAKLSTIQPQPQSIRIPPIQIILDQQFLPHKPKAILIQSHGTVVAHLRLKAY